MTASQLAVFAAAFSIAGLACVSPSTVGGDGGAGDGATGTGGMTTGGGTGGTTIGTGGATTRGGTGGMVVVGGQGGRTGQGGAPGVGGAVVTGPTANFTDDFETGDVNQRWLAPQSPDSTICGSWAVVAEGTTNHVYKQTASCSNPTFAAGGSIDWVDMRLQTKVRFDSASTVITIAIRYNTPKDLFWTEYGSDGHMKIRVRTTAGNSTDVTPNIPSSMRVAVTPGTWVTIGLKIAGSAVTAYIGDATTPPILTGTSSTLLKGGIAVGCSNGPCSFDDVVVTPN